MPILKFKLNKYCPLFTVHLTNFYQRHLILIYRYIVSTINTQLSIKYMDKENRAKCIAAFKMQPTYKSI